MKTIEGGINDLIRKHDFQINYSLHSPPVNKTFVEGSSDFDVDADASEGRHTVSPSLLFVMVYILISFHNSCQEWLIFGLEKQKKEVAVSPSSSSAAN